MKTRTYWSTMNDLCPMLRNMAFVAQLVMVVALGAFFLGFFRLPGMSFVRNYDVLAVGFGVCGLAVFLLTLGVKERRLQKGFFLLAGAAGVGILVTLAVFSLLKWAGHPPGGDGGGITVPMLLGCPVVFLIAAVGAIACLLKGARDKRKATSPGTQSTERSQP